MMPTELSVIDLAERGDLRGNFVEGTPRQVDAREPHRTSEAMAQPHASVVEAPDERLGKNSFL